MTSTPAPVLIIGGSGVVGAQAAARLRHLQPGLPLAIGGRDLAKAAGVAGQVEPASPVRVDLGRSDLALAPTDAFSAVIVFAKDDRLHAMRAAQDRGIPYVGLSSGTFEIGPDVAQYIQAPDKAPILLASHWLAGAALFPVLHFAEGYRRLRRVRIGVLLDELDMGGPAAAADYERIVASAPSALRREGGRYVWTRLDAGGGRYLSVDGVELPAQPYSPFDIMSLGAATGAPDVSMDLAYTVSASRRAGGPFSTEIVIELEGTLEDGGTETRRVEIVHPGGQAPLTALCVALAVERLLGLGGGPAPGAGLYFPELLLDPARVVQAMRDIGTVITVRRGVAA